MGVYDWMAEKEIDWIRYRSGSWSHDDAHRMDRFDAISRELKEYAYEELHLFYDARTRGRFAVAIHSTVLGPSLGGFRLFSYPSEYDAIHDVMRLARGMTLKSAAVGLPLGGGKAVGWLDKRGKSDELLRAFGRFLPRLEGRYITAEDVGTSVADMDFMDIEVRRHTDHPLVVCRSVERGGGGNPSPYTAKGVLEAMRIACERVFGTRDLSGRLVALQGLGNVGGALANMLLGEDASLLLSDIDYAKLQHVLEDPRCEDRCNMLPRQDLHSAQCDLFSPCAMGGVLNDRTIPKLDCRIVAGSANNQLEDEERDARLLSGRGILYVPDFIINSGGIINAGMEYLALSRGELYSPEAVEEKITEIFSNLQTLFDRAQASGLDTHTVALEMARERLGQT